MSQASIDSPPTPLGTHRLDRSQIERGLAQCPRLPSLSSINSSLHELLNADQRYTSHVAEIIRRDPSLTARLLRLVNSVYYGLSTPVNSIEEAVFYLGVRQIRQLAMVTPIIEDFQKLAGKKPFPWREFWQHCIGTALLSREVISSVHAPEDEGEYVAGLVHDVGVIVMAAAFPGHFDAIYSQPAAADEKDLMTREEAILGVNHAELGGLYLQHHHLPDLLVEAARYHHQPENSPNRSQVAAAVQIADRLVRHAGIGTDGDTSPVSEADWTTASGWDILFGQNATERGLAQANLRRSLERLPSLLEGLV